MLSKNEGINSVLIASDDQDDTAVGNNCLPRYITQRKDVNLDGISLDMDPAPHHTWYVAGGYDPLRMAEQRVTTSKSGGDPDAPVFAGAKKTASISTPTEKSMFTDAGHTVDPLEVVKSSVEKKSAVLLDVREQAEWDAGHLAEAQFIPLSQLKESSSFDTAIAPLPKDRPIYVHCRSGGRVLMFADLLAGKGYDIRPLKAGYDTLVQAGFTRAQ